MRMTNSERCARESRSRDRCSSLDHALNTGEVDRAIAIAMRVRDVIDAIHQTVPPADRKEADPLARLRLHGHLVLSAHLRQTWRTR